MPKRVWCSGGVKTVLFISVWCSGGVKTVLIILHTRSCIRDCTKKTRSEINEEQVNITMGQISEGSLS